MASIVTRVWVVRDPRGRRIRRVSYGYDLRVNGKRERRWSAEWTTAAAAMAALMARRQEVEAGIIRPRPT